MKWEKNESNDEFWVLIFGEIQHNSEHPGIGRNLEIGITGIHPKHWNSLEQPKM